MGKYTAYGKEVDSKIQSQLDSICKVIIKYLNPVSILLIGGFGRGEGSVIFKKGKFIPINDYDLYAITEKDYSSEVIEKMCTEASESIGKRCIDFHDYSKDMVYSIEKTFYPDIRVMTLNSLRKLPPFLKYYEIKYSSSVIYGKDILSQMPNFKITEVPNQDGLRFLMNRLSLMIMHFSPKFIKNTSPSDRERVINFNSKTALSCAEALLLYSRKFVSSYGKRAEILEKTFSRDFPELAKKIPKLPKIIRKYTNQKIKPDYNSIKEYIQDWFDLRDYSLEILNFLILKFTGKKAESPEELAKIMNIYYPMSYLKNYLKAKFNLKSNFLVSFLNPFANISLNLIYSRTLSSSTKRINLSPLLHPLSPPDMKIFPAAILIISSLNRDGTINSELFLKSRKYLKQVYPDNPKIYDKLDWEEMRKTFGTAFNLYGFQRLI